MFTKESLEQLKEKIALIEVVSAHVPLKRVGVSYKGLCPFHQEKSPSFIVKQGDQHFHCFGCGAHGDAIQFLMQFLNLTFVEAVESLAERFHVTLQKREKHQEAESNRSLLMSACEAASQFFHYTLFHSKEADEALRYLYHRGITPDFIRRFDVGFAPGESSLFKQAMNQQKIGSKSLVEAGLLNEKEEPFFRERITFPIRNNLGSVVGFSARKYKESTFGGKYINSPETPIFKKSKILFGLNFSRRRIAKERRALLVEGQIDCLRLIESGLNLTVAALGTAFGEAHVREIEKLGVRTVYILFDGDEAGQKAASKAGNFFQKKGIEVKVCALPKGSDPDSYLMHKGIESLIERIDSAEDYLAFQVGHLSRELNGQTPTGKAELVKQLKAQIQEWEGPVLIHESLKRLSTLLNLPQEIIGETMIKQLKPHLIPKERGEAIDPHRVLEMDLLRWLILLGRERPHFPRTAAHYLKEEHFWVPSCRTLFKNYVRSQEKDLLSLYADIEEPHLMDEILQKKVNLDRAESQFMETIQKLLDRHWMQTREEIKLKIHAGKGSEEEILQLAKEFDELKKHRQIAQWISNT